MFSVETLNAFTEQNTARIPEVSSRRRLRMPGMTGRVTSGDSTAHCAPFVQGRTRLLRAGEMKLGRPVDPT